MKYEDINLIGDIYIDSVSGDLNQAIGTDGTDVAWINTENGLSGQRYIFVHSKGTTVENGTRLTAAYTAATGLSPADDNRITIGVMAGYYDVGSGLSMNTPCINITSLSGECDVNIFASGSTSAIAVGANNISLIGLDCGADIISINGTFDKNFYINCKCGDKGFSGFGNFGTVQGTFIRCTGGNFSFCGKSVDQTYSVAAGGTYIDCIGGDYSFGGAETGTGNTASGTFDRCIGGQDAFGGNGLVSGTFTKCIGEAGSFGGEDGFVGSVYYCILNGTNFNTVDAGGKVIWCIESSGPATNQS